MKHERGISEVLEQMAGLLITLQLGMNYFKEKEIGCIFTFAFKKYGLYVLGLD
jgi:hypothetical protein